MVSAVLKRITKKSLLLETKNRSSQRVNHFLVLHCSPLTKAACLRLLKRLGGVKLLRCNMRLTDWQTGSPAGWATSGRWGSSVWVMGARNGVLSGQLWGHKAYITGAVEDRGIQAWVHTHTDKPQMRQRERDRQCFGGGGGGGGGRGGSRWGGTA